MANTTSSKKKKVRVADAPKFKINISDANHVGPLLTKLIAAEPNWQEVLQRNSATLRWIHANMADEEVLEWLNSGPTKMASRYPDIKVLAHKDVFAKAMQFCSDLDPEAFDFVP